MNAIPPVAPTAGDLSVLARPAGLKDRYGRITLISHRRHLGLLDPRDSDTLVLSTDWLAWRRCLDDGIHCLHFESFLKEWPAERGDPDTIHMRRCDWMLRDGRDITLFRGVSLGKLFIRDVALGCNASERIWHALDRAIRQFSPSEIVFHDLRAEHDLLDETVRCWMVRELAARHGVRLIEKLDVPSHGDPGFSERIDGFGAPVPESFVRRTLRAVYAEIVDIAFRIRDRKPRSPNKVLLILNWGTARSLIRRHHGSGLVPTLLAGHAPKNWESLRTWWRDGIALANPPFARLDADDRSALVAIRSAIEERWKAAADDIDIVRLHFIRSRLLDSGWLTERALEIKRFQRMFRRHRFARVVVGDATNGYCRLVADCARMAGVSVDELPNGMFVTKQRYDARLRGASGSPVVGRVLSWGPLTERWLAATEANVGPVVGYPALDGFRAPVAPIRFRRALVLPIYADADDAMAFTSNIFGSLVDTVRTLRIYGCAEIRVKIHVGPQNRDYYIDVLRAFGLDEPVFKDGAFVDHLQWADFVVGPVNSGAFVETLAAGKPYFPICPYPSQIDPALLPDIRLVRSGDDLLERLRHEDVPGRDAVLEDLCSFISIPDASRRFWAILGGHA